MAEDEVDRPDRKLQACRDIEQVGEAGAVAAAGLFEGVGIVVDDVERPEGEHRPIEKARQDAVDPLEEREDERQPGRVADVGGEAGAAPR